MKIFDWLRGNAFRKQLSNADRRSESYRPSFEVLESRLLPSVSNGGLLAGLSALRQPDLQKSVANHAIVAPSFASHTVVLHPGDSIQAAVDAAGTGTTIIDLSPGTYNTSQTIVINKPGIHLVGLAGSPVIIEDTGAQDNGISVSSAGRGFVLQNVTVQDFKMNGVLLTGVTNFAVSHVNAINDGCYGIFPVFCHDGVIQSSTASGNSDTGIYVGQSSEVFILNNKVHDNVNGIEIENCTKVSATGNEAYNNVTGIFVDLLPGLQIQKSALISVLGNFVHDNNHVNFSTDPLASVEPAGSGILVVGPDYTLIAGNKVTGNNFVGIGLASVDLIAQLAHLPPGALNGIDPIPDHALIFGNIATGNGSSPPVGLPGADLLWDGSGMGNHWIANAFGTSVPAVLP